MTSPLPRQAPMETGLSNLTRRPLRSRCWAWWNPPPMRSGPALTSRCFGLSTKCSSTIIVPSPRSCSPKHVSRYSLGVNCVGVFVYWYGPVLERSGVNEQFEPYQRHSVDLLLDSSTSSHFH
jgi:hypothetical protein